MKNSPSSFSRRTDEAALAVALPHLIVSPVADKQPLVVIAKEACAKIIILAENRK